MVRNTNTARNRSRKLRQSARLNMLATRECSRNNRRAPKHQKRKKSENSSKPVDFNWKQARNSSKRLVVRAQVHLLVQAQAVHPAKNRRRKSTSARTSSTTMRKN